MGIKERFTQFKAVTVKVAGCIRRRQQLSITVAVVLLIAGPLLTRTGGEACFPNPVSSTGQALVGLGVVTLVVRQIVRARERKQPERANCRRHCHRRQQRTTQPAPQGQQQHQGGIP